MSQTGLALNVPIDVSVPFKLAKQGVVNEFEKRYISRLLEQHGGNISAAARAAGIDRMSIHKMLHRLGLANPGRDEDEPGAGPVPVPVSQDDAPPDDEP